MARLLPSNRSQREEETGAEATARTLDLRTAVLGVGALAAGYVVGRRLWRTKTPSTGDLRERAGEALPGDGVDVPIGGTGEDERTAGAAADDQAAAADPSLEEVDERTSGDVEAEPAEPGEMQVDEDLVDEAVDDEDEAAE